MKNYLRLLAYIKPYKKRLAAAVVCIIMAAGANLYLPWIIKDMIDDVLMSKDMLMLNLIAAGILVVMFTRVELQHLQRVPVRAALTSKKGENHNG